MRILGVDPGCYGALALLDRGALASVHDMPYLKVRRGKTDKAEVDGYTLGALLRELAPDLAVIEQVGGMTGQSPSASFNFGRAAGAPEYALKAAGVRVEHVHPVVWKRSLKLNPGKDAARALAMRLWPSLSSSFARVKDDGRAEASLIAHYGHLTYGGSSVFD
jgi:crossover junction endodeoxyribonuclease RuvC